MDPVSRRLGIRLLANHGHDCSERVLLHAASAADASSVGSIFVLLEDWPTRNAASVVGIVADNSRRLRHSWRSDAAVTE
ncbi:MAG: hypothetical protein ACI8W7_000713 [Gammaproteobacteria bacterium]|jgi:hypothetical protein